MRALKRFGRPDRGIVVYDGVANPIAAAPETHAGARLQSPEITEAISRAAVATGFRTIEGRKTYVYATPLQQDDRTVGALAVFLDAGQLAAAETELWQLSAVRFFALALGISLITFLVLRMTIMRPMSALAEWTKTLKVGKPGAAALRARRRTCSAPSPRRSRGSRGTSIAPRRRPSARRRCAWPGSRRGRRSGSSSSCGCASTGARSSWSRTASP